MAQVEFSATVEEPASDTLTPFISESGKIVTLQGPELYHIFPSKGRWYTQAKDIVVYNSSTLIVKIHAINTVGASTLIYSHSTLELWGILQKACAASQPAFIKLINVMGYDTMPKITLLSEASYRIHAPIEAITRDMIAHATCIKIR